MKLKKKIPPLLILSPVIIRVLTKCRSNDDYKILRKELKAQEEEEETAPHGQNFAAFFQKLLKLIKVNAR